MKFNILNFFKFFYLDPNIPSADIDDIDVDDIDIWNAILLRVATALQHLNPNISKIADGAIMVEFIKRNYIVWITTENLELTIGVNDINGDHYWHHHYCNDPEGNETDLNSMLKDLLDGKRELIQGIKWNEL